MFCEHPQCSSEANAICKSHCYLSLCQQHRFEHESKILYDVEKQLDNLSSPLSGLLNKFQSELKKSEDSRQQELNRINSLFDSYLLSIDQRSKLIKTVNESIKIKHEELLRCKNGDSQLTKEDYQQLKTLSDQIETNLHEQNQLSTQIRNKNFSTSLCLNKKDNHQSIQIECIEISDSDDESPQYTKNISNQNRYETINNTPVSNKNINPPTSNKLAQKRKSDLWSLRDFCPLIQPGVFGLDGSYKSLRLCSKKNNKQRYLYVHFTRTHRIEPSIALKLLKAIQDGCDPMETKIFPDDNTKAFIEDIQCPFDDNAREFTRNNSIPNTPCYISSGLYCFKNHLRTVHCITKLNADLIYHAMKDYGHIKHVQFQDNLCEIK